MFYLYYWVVNVPRGTNQIFLVKSVLKFFNQQHKISDFLTNMRNLKIRVKMERASIGIEDVKNSIRNVPNFPKEGIQFKDVSTAFKDKGIFKFIVSEIRNKYQECGITKVVGIESRGFILGSILAGELHAGFVPIRKPGKLPSETFVQSYDLEYGSDALEIHTDALG